MGGCPQRGRASKGIAVLSEPPVAAQPGRCLLGTADLRAPWVRKRGPHIAGPWSGASHVTRSHVS